MTRNDDFVPPPGIEFFNGIRQSDQTRDSGDVSWIEQVNFLLHIGNATLLSCQIFTSRRTLTSHYSRIVNRPCQFEYSLTRVLAIFVAEYIATDGYVSRHDKLATCQIGSRRVVYQKFRITVIRRWRRKPAMQVRKISYGSENYRLKLKIH